MLVKFAFVLILLHTNSILSNPIEEDANEQLFEASCNGAFDIYFVLDLSSSLIRLGGTTGQVFVNHFQDETVSFVEDLVSKFTSHLQRLSFITFNARADVVLPLTDDRAVIRRKLTELRNAKPAGMTRLDLGLVEVNSQIRRFGEQRASVVIILTDGRLTDTVKTAAVRRADAIRRLGGTIIPVGVANFDAGQLKEVAGGSDQLIFQAATFAGLQNVVEKIIEESCIEIIAADPDTVCYNTSFVIEVQGRGFDKGGDPDDVKCNFWFSEEESYLITPSVYSPTRLVCASPENVTFSPDDVITLQVTLNDGISFISSNVTISSSACATPGVVWAFLALLALLALLLLWWFSKACCCLAAATKVEEETTETKPPPPPPPAAAPKPKPPTTTKQWPTVDASFYGGRGAGGINPMKVTWGDKGCTEAAIHLEKTKDAQEVGFIEKEVEIADENKPRPNRPPPPARSRAATITQLCCCGLCNSNNKLTRMFAPVVAFINRISVRRPSKEDVKNWRFMKPSHDRNGNIPSSKPKGDYLDTNK